MLLLVAGGIAELHLRIAVLGSCRNALVKRYGLRLVPYRRSYALVKRAGQRTGRYHGQRQARSLHQRCEPAVMLCLILLYT